MTKVLAAIAALLFIINPAEARHHRHHHLIKYDRNNYESNSTIVSHPANCPWHAFCGCGVSVKVFGHPVRELFLASNWFKFPRTHPAAGMVAVRNHHVMAILAMDANGNATVYDPNSGGHQTRIHIRSLAGYTVVNPHASRSSSETRYSVREVQATFQAAGLRDQFY